jgi:hypothetical protein
MAISQQIRTLQYNQNLIRYFLQSIWKLKFWFLVVMVICGALATMTVYLNPPKFKAKATFISDLPIVTRQVESLESRDMLLRSVDKLQHVKVRCYTKGSFGRESDFYNRTPVALQIESFPEHLRNVEMRLSFSGDSKYTLSFEALGEKVAGTGRFGSLLSVGSIGIIVEPTKYWSDRYLGEEVLFQVHSLQYVVGQVAANYRVENVTHRKNRIAIFYSDDNPDRAYDILNAVAKEAITSYHRDFAQLVESRVGRIRNQMDVLLEKMVGDDNMGRLLQGEDFEGMNDQIDSMVVVLQMLSAQTARLQLRDSLLHDLKTTFFVGEGFQEAFSFSGSTAEDSTLLKMLNVQIEMRFDTNISLNTLRSLNLSIQKTVRSILLTDSVQAIQIENQKNDLEDRLMTDIQLRRTVVSNAIDRRDRNNQAIMSWEAYLSLAYDKYRTEQETSENAHFFNLIESPYVINPARRVVQLRKVISGALIGAFLMLGFVLLTAFGSGKIRSSEHLRVLSSLSLNTFVKGNDRKKAVRSIQVAIEMERNPEEKVISVLTVREKAVLSDWVEALAQRYASTGMNLHVLRDEESGKDSDAQEGDLSIYLLSRDRKKRLAEAIENHDLVIQELPVLEDYPESWYLVNGHRHLIYLAAAGDTNYTEIKELESMMEKNQLQVYLAFQDRR